MTTALVRKKGINDAIVTTVGLKLITYSNRIVSKRTPALHHKTSKVQQSVLRNADAALLDRQ